VKALATMGCVFVMSLGSSAALANGLCPYDDQGPLGCPEGTIWYENLEVCLPPQKLS